MLYFWENNLTFQTWCFNIDGSKRWSFWGIVSFKFKLSSNAQLWLYERKWVEHFLLNLKYTEDDRISNHWLMLIIRILWSISCKSNIFTFFSAWSSLNKTNLCFLFDEPLRTLIIFTFTKSYLKLIVWNGIIFDLG